MITDSAGVIKAESDYYPWGGELQFVNNDSNDYKFTGKKRDLETGLDYFGARYYSNGLGRWISADWSATPVPVPYADFNDPQSFNQYTYVRNNPSYSDPDGHQDTATDIKVDMEVVKQLLATVGPVAGPTITAAGPAAVLAAPSAVGMGMAVALPPMQNTPDGSPNLILDALNPPYVPAPPVEGQTQETERQPEPAPASAAPPMKGGKDGAEKPGEVYITEPQKSGKPYVGRTTQGVDKRMATRTDGRSGKAKTVETYKTRQEGRVKEQQQIDKHGLKKLDNKRNEIRKPKPKAE